MIREKGELREPPEKNKKESMTHNNYDDNIIKKTIRYIIITSTKNRQLYFKNANKLNIPVKNHMVIQWNCVPLVILK